MPKNSKIRITYKKCEECPFLGGLRLRGGGGGVIGLAGRKRPLNRISGSGARLLGGMFGSHLSEGTASARWSLGTPLALFE
jgi:hypothetical protein